MTSQELRFFIHRDPDAVRVEVAGSLSGVEVETLYQAWQREASSDGVKPVIVDITFITDADDYGIGILAIFHRFGAQIVANSPEAYAIASTIVIEPAEIAASKPGWFRRLIRLLTSDRAAGAAFPASAEILHAASAHHQPRNVDYSGFGDFGAMDASVH